MEDRIKNMYNDAWKMYKEYIAKRNMEQLNKNMEMLIAKYDYQQDIKDLVVWFAARIRGLQDEWERGKTNGKRN